MGQKLSHDLMSTALRFKVLIQLILISFYAETRTLI